MIPTFTAADVLRERLTRPGVLAPTGIADLDDLLGGLRAGQLWLVVSPPRAGRSMLSIQLAAALARAGTPTRYLIGADRPHEVVSRFIAHSEGIGLTRSRDLPASPEQEWTRWPLDFVPSIPGASVGAWDGLPTLDHCAVVIDDLDLWRIDALDVVEELRLWSDTKRRIAVVTLPEHVLGRDEPETWQRWVRMSDVILDLAEDVDGDAALRVLSHRCGPRFRLQVECHLEYVRFCSPGEHQRTDPPHAQATTEQSDHGDSKDAGAAPPPEATRREA